MCVDMQVMTLQLDQQQNKQKQEACNVIQPVFEIHYGFYSKQTTGVRESACWYCILAILIIEAVYVKLLLQRKV